MRRTVYLDSLRGVVYAHPEDAIEDGTAGIISAYAYGRWVSGEPLTVIREPSQMALVVPIILSGSVGRSPQAEITSAVAY